ncbi:MAG TPA: hypothetical protein VJR89_13435, partial [Polyangiales bacterium]|nr:hypothetical protein [Polyangiales bacterium]
INAFNLAIGYRIWADSGAVWPLAAAIGITAFFRNVMPVARRALLKSVFTGRPVRELAARPEPGAPSKLREFVQENVIHATNQWVVLSALLALVHFGLAPYLLLTLAFGATMAVLALRELVGLARLLRGDQLEYELARIYSAAARTPDSAADGLSLAKFSVL